VRVPRLGDASLPSPFSTRVFTGHEAQITHELTRRGEATEVPQFRYQGNGGGELEPAPGWHGLDNRRPAPARHEGGKCDFQPLQAVALFGDRPDICLEAELWSGRRTDHVG